jgi:hypothetical protein
MNDTSPEIAAMIHARMMAKTGEQRKKLLFQRFYGADHGTCRQA